MFTCEGIYYKSSEEESEVVSPCKHLPFYKKHEEKKYCVLHLPHEDKLEDFSDAVIKKFENQDYNYRGIWIPSHFFFNRQTFTSIADFSYAFFNGDANFEYCIFEKEAVFDNVIFNSEAIFNHVNFGHFTSFFGSKFNKAAVFNDTVFGTKNFKSEVTFFETVFSDKANFIGAVFDCIVYFHSTKFDNSAIFDLTTFTSIADFNNAEFKEAVSFTGEYFRFFNDNGNRQINRIFGDESSLNLQFSTFSSPEKVTFHTVLLKPHWFVNTDPRKFDFADVKWINTNGGKKVIESEIEDLAFRRYESLASPYKLFIIACKRLASNAEENNRLEEASDFRKMAFETEWLEKSVKSQKWFDEILFANERIRRWFGYKDVDLLASLKKVLYIIRHFDFLHPLYRFTSYYGESWRHAFFVLLIILAISTFLYTTSYCVFKDGKQGFDIWEAISYSLRVMALQRPEPFPENSFSKIVVALQTIFSPLQLALLALAIRRKFMR
jgi:hypothetical protein